MGVQTFGQHPRYAFSEQRILNGVLTGSSLSGTSAERPAGTRFAVAVGVFTLLGGSGEVQLLLEGSNDGTNWFTASSTSGSDNFTATATTVLNSANTGMVDLQRFLFLRFRAVVASGTPTFTLQAILTAISDDSEVLSSTTLLTRLGTTPTIQFGDPYDRPSGTLLANAQVTASGVVHNGVTEWVVALQGSPDGGETWITIGTCIVSANGSQLLTVSGETLFSLGAYAQVRFGIADADGPAGAATAYSISCVLSLDSMDWVNDQENDSGGGVSPFDPDTVFTQVVFDEPGTEAGDAIDLTFSLLDVDGNPILESRMVELIVYDTSNAGDLDLSENATFASASVGTIIAGADTNRVLVSTDASGTATLSIFDDQADTVFVCAVQQGAPIPTPQLLVKSEEAELEFA